MTAPQPITALRQHLAEAMAKEAGSKAFMESGTAWDHARSEWLAHADAAVNALHRWEQAAPEVHEYLSTGCLHGEHAYCQSMTGQQGRKRPGQCKFCAAKCRCACHGVEAGRSPPGTRRPPVRPLSGLGHGVACGGACWPCAGCVRPA